MTARALFEIDVKACRDKTGNSVNCDSNSNESTPDVEDNSVVEDIVIDLHKGDDSSADTTFLRVLSFAWKAGNFSGTDLAGRGDP